MNDQHIQKLAKEMADTETQLRQLDVDIETINEELKGRKKSHAALVKQPRDIARRVREPLLQDAE